MNDNEWTEAFDALKKPEEVYYGQREQGQRGKPMVFKVSTPGSAKYGIVLEFSQSGDVYLKTLYKGTDNSIEESVKKEELPGASYQMASPLFRAVILYLYLVYSRHLVLSRQRRNTRFTKKLTYKTSALQESTINIKPN